MRLIGLLLSLTLLAATTAEARVCQSLFGSGGLPSIVQQSLERAHRQVRLDPTVCPECPATLYFHQGRDAHLSEHIWNSSERRPFDEVLHELAEIDHFQSHPSRLSRSLPLLKDLASKSRLSKPTSLATSEAYADFLMRFAEGKLVAKNYLLQENGMSRIEINTKGNRFAVIFCARSDCARGSRRIGDVITIFPVCGSAVIEVPAYERVSELLSALQPGPNRPFPPTLNRAVRAGLARRKICL